MLKKIVISLLLAVIVFALFFVFSLSGLFEYVETNLYSSRVQARYEQTMMRARTVIEWFHQANLSRFETILNESVVNDLFSFNLSRESILRLETLFGRLNEQLDSFSFVRVYDTLGERLWFSTYRADTVVEESAIRQYIPITSLNDDYFSPQEIIQSDSILLSDPVANHLLYRLPLVDQFEGPLGVIVFYFSTDDLLLRLTRENIVDLDEQVVILRGGSLLLNSNQRFGRSLYETLETNIEEIIAADGGYPLLNEEQQTGYLAFSDTNSEFNPIVLLAPKSDFIVNQFVRNILLAIIFITSFLIFFLILNLRQDPMVVIAERIKRFQIYLLKEYVEDKKRIDWKKWQTELEEQRIELSRRIRKGLPSSKRIDPDKIETLIEVGWNEIISAISRYSGVDGEGFNDNSDFARLEALLRQLVGNLSVGGSVQPIVRPLVNLPQRAPQEEEKEIEESEPVSELEMVESSEPEEFSDVANMPDVDTEPIDEKLAWQGIDDIEPLESEEPIYNEGRGGTASLSADQHSGLLRRAMKYQVTSPVQREAPEVIIESEGVYNINEKVYRERSGKGKGNDSLQIGELLDSVLDK